MERILQPEQYRFNNIIDILMAAFKRIFWVCSLVLIIVAITALLPVNTSPKAHKEHVAISPQNVELIHRAKHIFMDVAQKVDIANRNISAVAK